MQIGYCYVMNVLKTSFFQVKLAPKGEDAGAPYPPGVLDKACHAFVCEFYHCYAMPVVTKEEAANMQWCNPVLNHANFSDAKKI